MAPERVRELIGWLSPSDGARAVDLGCGEGEWLQELLLAHLQITGAGIDHMLPAAAAQRANNRKLGERERWIEADAADWSDGLFDVVVVRWCEPRLRAAGGHAGCCPAAPASRRSGADR